MAYQQSPGVEIKEKDASAVTIGLSSTVGATVGAFRWGPVMNPMLVSNESKLVTVFGEPDTKTAPYFFAAANFLGYTNSCWVTRVLGSTTVGEVTSTTAKNASTSGTGILINNFDHYEVVSGSDNAAAGTFAARYPGVLGSGLKVSIADSGTFAAWEYKSAFSVAPGTSEYAVSKGASNDELHIVVVDGEGKFSGTVGAILEKYEFVSKASDAVSYQGTNNYYVQVIANKSEYVYWLNHPIGTTNWGNETITLGAAVAYESLVNINVTGTATTATWVTGTATITFPALTAAPFVTGEQIVLSGFTPAAYNGTHTVVTCSTTAVTFLIATNPGVGTVYGIVTGPYDHSYKLTGGLDGETVEDGNLEQGWDLFVDQQTYDVSLLVTGNASIALARYVVQNIADVRKDCVAFTSITATAANLAEPIPSNSTSKELTAKAFKTFDSTYAVIDSGYKYMYDKYNDKYRWIALNADTAGLCARVDVTNDPWHSPAGMTKGQVKNVVKLSWNPNKTERDAIYPAAINPVINLAGQGTLLFGDRTATAKPSAFDKINVRRLFLILEKSIANSAKYQLFELNDEITRLQFVSSVEPFLRNVKGRRGIDDYRVICDETNNTPQVIASNSFVGTILVRAKYSINYITLNFTATGPDVTFEQAALV